MNLLNMLFVIVVCIVVSNISLGCARIEKKYIAPPGGEGRSCLKQCGKQQQKCKNACASKHSACTGQAQDKHAQEKAAYQADTQKLTAEAQAKVACSSHKNFFKRTMCEASASSAPRLDTSHCDKECGCANDYDLCWTQCGGTIKNECVANCN